MIDAVISFVAVAFFLFLVVKAYNHMQARQPKARRRRAGADVVLLTEIRDELRSRQG